jgi:hypothetical protein
MLGEEIFHFAFGGGKRQVAHVDLGHSNVPKKMSKHTTTGLKQAD